MEVLVVEDNRTNLTILARLVGQVEGCSPVAFSDPKVALAFALNSGCDLVLVDFVMPGMNGIEFIRALREHSQTADLPVVMVTADSDRGVRQAAIQAGATDFITKPVDPIEFKARLRNLAALRRAHLAERDRSGILMNEVAQATRLIVQREQEIILKLMRAAEYRDGSTGAHIERIAHYARMIAEEMRLAPAVVEDIFMAAPMHDIGKLAVPDSILIKEGPLTEEEWTVMKRHTIQGAEILGGTSVPLLRLAADIALNHHERFDGSGYPNGRSGSAIPLAARIVAVADVFDALTTGRVYKPAWSIDAARDRLLAERGRQFDPVGVDAFLRRWSDIAAFHDVKDQARSLVA